jgi:hypothetical protein
LQHPLNEVSNQNQRIIIMPQKKLKSKTLNKARKQIQSFTIPGLYDIQEKRIIPISELHPTDQQLVDLIGNEAKVTALAWIDLGQPKLFVINVSSKINPGLIEFYIGLVSDLIKDTGLIPPTMIVGETG